MEEKITSFVQLFDTLLSTTVVELDIFKEVVAQLPVDFKEVKEFGNMVYNIITSKLPVIVGGALTVKVVQVSSENESLLIYPEDVAVDYLDFTEETRDIKDINIGFNLLAEVYGATIDDDLYTFIRETYLSANDSSSAYEEIKKTEQVSVEGIGFKQDEEALPKEEVDITFIQESLNKNKGLFEKFSLQDDALDRLLKLLREELPAKVLENLKLGTHKNVFILEADNNKIYEAFGMFPVYSKYNITRVGETLRNSKDFQLIDTFTKEDKRYYIVAESKDNYWYVEGEQPRLDNNSSKLVPLKENIIVLKHSNIHESARKHKLIKDSKGVIGFTK